MRAALRSRLERLEVRLEPKKPHFFRTGYLKTLPTDYVGERHVVIVKREPSGNGEWCEFEERPGPAPVDAQERGGEAMGDNFADEADEAMSQALRAQMSPRCPPGAPL